MPVDARVTPVGELTPKIRDEMFALMTRHYENVRRDIFERDLAEKDTVILLADADSDHVCGFSTQLLLDADVAGRPIRALFSGDTIVDREHWGSPALAIGFGTVVLSVMERFPGDELYWYLMSKGFRTYRIMAAYFKEFFPRFDATTPPEIRDVIDSVAAVRYSERFDQAAGIVRASANSDRLRAGLGEVTDERLNDAHIEFFASRNPGHAAGDELCCVTQLCEENFSAVARRLINSDRFARQRLG